MGKKKKILCSNYFSQYSMISKIIRRGFATQTNRPKVFFDIEINGKATGRMTFELYSDITPKTSENFRQLCTGEAGTAKSANVPLHYKDSIFHRVIPGFVAQGGDFTRGDGRGGESIYGSRFPDENFNMKHEGVGKLSMANAGPNTNGSQFFITYASLPHLNGKHTVFGELVDGMKVLKEMERYGGGGQMGTPTGRIVIVDCGEIKAESS